MRIRINLRAAGHNLNHSEPTTRGSAQARGLKVMTKMKAGKLATNHNQTVAAGLRIKSNIKAGGYDRQHNQTMRRI